MGGQGRRDAGLATGERSQALFLRALDSTTVRKLQRTEGAVSPFWSPDGLWVAYTAGGKLWKTAADGSTVPEALCDAEPRGVNASWGGNTILFSDRNPKRGIFRVPSTGGKPVEVTTVTTAEWRHGAPHVLADGRHFLYLRFKANSLDRDLVLASIGDPNESVLLRNVSQVQRLSDDRIAYVRDGRLFAQRFDVGRGTVVGDPSAIADDVRYFYLTGNAQFSAANGVVVFATETSTGRLTLVDPHNRVIRVLEDQNLSSDVSISPGGKRAAVTLTSRTTGLRDLWIYDLTRGLKDRFTGEPGLEMTPVWTPDGRSIIYADTSGGRRPHLVRRALASSTSIDLLPRTLRDFEFAGSITRDASALFFTRFVENANIMRLDMTTKVVSSVVATNADEADAQVSPDGQWLAYSSDASGTFEVYVLNLAGKGAERIRISHDSGRNPRWRSNGQELFYLSLQGVMMSVIPSASGDWSDTRATELFRAPKGTVQFAVTPDGQSFLIAEQTAGKFDDAFHVVIGRP